MTAAMATFGGVLFIVIIFVFPLRSFAVLPEYELQEKLPVNTEVGNIKRDFSMRSNYSDVMLSSLRYRFKNPNDYFKMDDVTGVIRIKHVIDRDVICKFQDRCVINCDVIVESNEFYDIVAVAYVILDVNDNSPGFSSSKTRLEISEATPVGTVFLLPSAEDSDGEEFGVKDYRMEGGQDTFELKFQKHSDELKLRLRKALDREQVTGYSMRIVAEDGGSPPKTANLDLEIIVKDVNDNSPKLPNENYEATLEENLPVGTRILQVKADDPDEGVNGNLTYSFTNDTLTSYGDVFGIHQDGWIFVAGLIDYERDRRIVLTVLVADQGVMPLAAYARVAIYVSDVNDNEPVININSILGRREAEVRENLPPGAFVSHIVVTDADGSDNGRVTCDVDNSRFRLTTISEEHSEYKLVTTDTFDREEHSQETLVMSCRDRGVPPRSSSRTIRVWIIDENDNTPRFNEEKVRITLCENNVIGTHIATFNVTDLDDGENAMVNFTIEAVGSTPPGSLFVNSLGIITANTVLDYEVLDVYSYLVVARDRGLPSLSSHAQLDIQIEDTNDERPTFEVNSYVFRILENLPPGTLLGKVRAFDDDKSFNYRRIHYSFVEAQPHLSIDPKTGEITIAKVIDRENQSSVKVKVRASNDQEFHSTGTMYSEVNVRIYVEDENDNSPVITFPNSLNNTLIIRREPKVRERIGRIEAFDLDEGSNANLTFSINESSEAAKYFRVEPSTGWIFIADGYEKSFSDLGTVRLIVCVTDQGRPFRSSTEALVLVEKGGQEVAVELPRVELVEDSSMLIAVGVGCGVLATVVLVTLAIVCFRVHRCKMKNRHSYNCRIEAKKATSDCSLNTYTNRLGSGGPDGSKSPPPEGEFRSKESRGTGKKGVRFNLDQEIGPFISSPITDCKLSCPFPEECAFHRHDIPSSKDSSPSYHSLHEPLYAFGVENRLASGTPYRPCHQPLGRYPHQVVPQQILLPNLPQRTIRKVEIPTIGQILFNRNNEQQQQQQQQQQTCSVWTQPTSYPPEVRTSSVPERWSSGSLPDSGQGPSDGEESGVFYSGSQEPFFPAESNV